MQIPYCLPIIKKNKQDVLEMIKTNMDDYPYFEVWLDEIEDLDDAFIAEITTLLQERLILLFYRGIRRSSKRDMARRLQILSLVSKTNAFFDLDLSEKEELAFVQKNKLELRLITSYHNYEETPDKKTLHAMIQLLQHHHPTIVKVATMCHSEADALRLLQLQQDLKKENQRHVVLGMGPYGTITRIFGTLWGNAFIFAPKTLREKSAEGQLTKGQLETILKALVL